MSESRPVLRVCYPDLTEFERLCYAKNQPAVITGVPEQHALKIFRFSPEYLEQEIGDLEFPVLSTETSFLSYERDTESMKFKDFVTRTFRGEIGSTKYYFKNPTKVLPAGLDDSESITGLQRFFVDAPMRNLWISRGTITVGLHFDAAENLNIQIRGRKSFMLYPPGVSGYYPFPMFSQTAHISRVFREGPDLDAARFPRFDPGKGQEVILEEGEILYLPAYWWHQVTSLGEVNVNLNTWSLPSASKQLKHWNQALRGYGQLLSRYIAFGDIVKAPAANQPAAKARGT